MKALSKQLHNHQNVMLAIGVLVIFLGSLWYLFAVNSGGITGFALIPNATASITIVTKSSIKFSQDTVSWGSGSVNTSGGFDNCTMSTHEGGNYVNTGCEDFNELTNGFTIENDGNTNLTVEMRSNASATQFIGAGLALFLWNVTYNESGSCLNVSGSNQVVSPNTSAQCGSDVDPVGSSCGSEFEAVSTTDKVICPRLRFTDASDSLNIDINVSIPDNSPAGSKLAGLIVTGTRTPLV